MPSTLTYPGVYIEEIPSGVRTIVGVATSITAFIGRALCGPDNQPVIINSFGDFEREFGGLWNDSSLGFAVRDFFLNGGSQAIVVRLFHIDAGKEKAKFTIDGLTLEAASAGSWGANLRINIDVNVSPDVAIKMGLTKEDLFNLTIRDSSIGGVSEKFLNVSVQNVQRRVDRVLENSKLMRWSGSWPASILLIPLIKAAHEAAAIDLPAALLKLNDPITIAEINLDTAKKATTPVPADITDAETKLTAAIKTMKYSVSDGQAITKSNDFTPPNALSEKKGLYALENVDLFNLLCIPPYTAAGDVEVSLVAEAAAYCEKRRAFLVLDPPSKWTDKSIAKKEFTDLNEDHIGTRSKNAALFFPRLVQANPLRDNQLEEFAPCGTIAGIFARTDSQRGVWKAPAGLDATLVGTLKFSEYLSDAEIGELNPLGINCLRSVPGAGRVVWGSRTLQGNDLLASEWKYIPIRRLALYIEESLYRGTQWIVFESNDEPLWAQIRLNLGAFMHNLFRQGAFAGSSPRDAYFVKCDKETTPPNDVNLGIVNIIVGFAPLKPAEFVVIKIQQIAGQIQT